MATPLQCPACARFLSRGFARRAADTPQPCPKCERGLVAILDDDGSTVILADDTGADAPAVADVDGDIAAAASSLAAEEAVIPAGVGATPVDEMTSASEQPPDVVDDDELAEEAGIYAAAVGDDVVDPETIDDEDRDEPPAGDVAPDGADALPVPSSADVPIPAVPAREQADVAAAGDTSAAAPAPAELGEDRDPLAGWDAGSARDVAEIPQQGTEAITLVVAAVTAGLVLGVFSGRRRLLRSALGAALGALAAAGVRRAGAGRDLRRP